jgi:iron complex outermembrane recepter protein
MSSRSRKCAARYCRTAPALLPRGTKIGLAVAAALAGAALPHSPALAAEAADTSSGPSTGLQEVVVTARKREENLQDVPISIDVFTKKDMQDLAINSFDDFAQKTPSVSFISVGPGTQVFVMRGVSDGSDPNYANTSATGFFVDDMSMSDSGSQPDLLLYDIESIEVLNGPQGTTFGAGSMSGAIRYTTVKPDVNAFSAGVDMDAGHIQGGQNNWLYEGFLNAPVIPGILGLRVSAFSDSHGGFINNELTTRTWVNGAVSNNAQWARNDYNREHREGGRATLKADISEKWSATLMYGYQRQRTLGAWDEDPTLPARTVERFGPEYHEFQAKYIDFHIDGDVGIGDLVFASTYWSQPTRQYNEYSQYMQNFNAGAKTGGGFPGTQEGLTCATDPYYGSGAAYSGCKVPTQFYEYHTNPTRESNELRLVSKPGGRFHWLGGLYWERTTDKDSGSTYYIPNINYSGQAFQSYAQYYNQQTPSLRNGVWYAYIERSDYLQTTEFANISFDITDKLNVEAGTVHFHSDFKYYTPYSQFAYYESGASGYSGDSHKWNSKFGINYKITDHAMTYALFSQGFRDGGVNAGDPANCYNSTPAGPGVPYKYTPDTLNNYEIGLKTSSLQNRLTWNGAAYYMDWKQLQTLIYNPLVCPSSSFNINVGQARIYGAETNINFQPNESWAFQAAASYTDAHIISTLDQDYSEYVGERLPFAPYFSWSWNARYQQPVSRNLKGYVQFDMAHKGDMWSGFTPRSTFTDLPRVLQPGFTLMNLRFGLTPDTGRWMAELYVDNLTDKNAIVFSNTGNYDLRLTTNEPRVFGVRLNYRFGKETNPQ